MASTDLPGREPASNQKTEAKVDLRATLTKLDWRQGSLLRPVHIEKLLKAGHLKAFSAGSQFVVATHDCDLLHGSLELEPKAECLVATPVAKADGRYTFGKSPRILHLNIGGNPHEIKLANRCEIPRDHLAEDPPDTLTLREQEISLIADWLSKRYVREAFPNSFEMRIDKPSWKKILNTLRLGGEVISGIYLLIVGDELPEGEPYEIAIKATLNKKDFADKDIREGAQLTIDGLAGILRECKGISVSEADVVSESQISLDNLHYLKRWDFDDLSVQAD